MDSNHALSTIHIRGAEYPIENYFIEDQGLSFAASPEHLESVMRIARWIFDGAPRSADPAFLQRAKELAILTPSDEVILNALDRRPKKSSSRWKFKQLEYCSKKFPCFTVCYPTSSTTVCGRALSFCRDDFAQLANGLNAEVETIRDELFAAAEASFTREGMKSNHAIVPAADIR